MNVGVKWPMCPFYDYIQVLCIGGLIEPPGRPCYSALAWAVAIWHSQCPGLQVFESSKAWQHTLLIVHIYRHVSNICVFTYIYVDVHTACTYAEYI